MPMTPANLSDKTPSETQRRQSLAQEDRFYAQVGGGWGARALAALICLFDRR